MGEPSAVNPEPAAVNPAADPADGSVAVAVPGSAPAAVSTPPRPVPREAAWRAGRLPRAVSVDLHVDSVLWAHDAGADLVAGCPEAHVDLPRLRAGGVDAAFFAAWIHPAYAERGAAFARAAALVRSVRALAARPDGFVLATGPADVERAAAEGRVAACIGVEGGHAIENSLERLRELHALGVRLLTLTWANTNDWADAAGGARRHGGLAPFGREVVRTMNRLGMIVDVSHVSDETFYDVLDASEAPVVASHSGVRSHTPHPRNLSDEMLRALSAQGGVVGIPAYGRFVEPGFDAAFARWEASLADRLARARAAHPDDPGRAELAAERVRRAEAHRLPRVPLDRVVEQIERAVDVAGIDHVAIGTDFDGIPHTPTGFEDAGRWPNLARALAARGYDPEAVAKVLGANALRVWRAVERAAGR